MAEGEMFLDTGKKGDWVKEMRKSASTDCVFREKGSRRYVYTCPECGKNVCHLDDHLFYKHNFGKDQIAELKKERRANLEISCPHCERKYKCNWSLRKHMQKCCPSEQPNYVKRVRCPNCDFVMPTISDLVHHCAGNHLDISDEYRIENLSFDNWEAFKQWKRAAEERTGTSFVVKSKKPDDMGRVAYYKCHRSGEMKAAHTKHAVSHCTAFITARSSTTDSQIRVSYCLAHIGHQIEYALLRLDEEAKNTVAELLKEGMTTTQVKRKIREKFRGGGSLAGTSNRLFFITTADIRTIARRKKLIGGRAHENDILSLESRITLNDDNDGLLYYSPATNSSGDGFCLVRQIIACCFSTELPNVEKELIVLFEEVRKKVPNFRPRFFMSDDASSFYNAFAKVFPETATKKLLCNWHVQRAIRKSARKLRNNGLKEMLSSYVSNVCSSPNAQEFAKRYGQLLTFFTKEEEYEMVNYFHTYWTHRIQEWSAHCRKGAVMHTSMLCERWHRRLKREILASKTKIRLDDLVDALIAAVREFHEENFVTEARNLVEGRYRLQCQHINHIRAVNAYSHMQSAINVVEPGRWEIRCHKTGRTYLVEQSGCPCAQINNHCRKPNCGACPYAFTCDCNMDRKAGISCLHIHAVMLYSHPEDHLPLEVPEPVWFEETATEYAEGAESINASNVPPPPSNKENNLEALQLLEMKFSNIKAMLINNIDEEGVEVILKEAVKSLSRIEVICEKFGPLADNKHPE